MCVFLFVGFRGLASLVSRFRVYELVSATLHMLSTLKTCLLFCMSAIVSLRIRGVHTTIKHSTRKVPGPFGKIRCVKTYALSGSKCNLLEFSFALSRESCSNSSPTPMSAAASSSKIIIASQSKFKQNLCVNFGSFAGPH